MLKEKTNGVFKLGEDLFKSALSRELTADNKIRFLLQ